MDIGQTGAAGDVLKPLFGLVTRAGRSHTHNECPHSSRPNYETPLVVKDFTSQSKFENRLPSPALHCTSVSNRTPRLTNENKPSAQTTFTRLEVAWPPLDCLLVIYDCCNPKTTLNKASLRLCFPKSEQNNSSQDRHASGRRSRESEHARETAGEDEPNKRNQCLQKLFARSKQLPTSDA